MSSMVNNFKLRLRDVKKVYKNDDARKRQLLYDLRTILGVFLFIVLILANK